MCIQKASCKKSRECYYLGPGRGIQVLPQADGRHPAITGNTKRCHPDPLSSSHGSPGPWFKKLMLGAHEGPLRDEKVPRVHLCCSFENIRKNLEWLEMVAHGMERKGRFQFVKETSYARAFLTVLHTFSFRFLKSNVPFSGPRLSSSRDCGQTELQERRHFPSFAFIPR